MLLAGLFEVFSEVEKDVCFKIDFESVKFNAVDVVVIVVTIEMLDVAKVGKFDVTLNSGVVVGTCSVDFDTCTGTVTLFTFGSECVTRFLFFLYSSDLIFSNTDRKRDFCVQSLSDMHGPHNLMGTEC